MTTKRGVLIGLMVGFIASAGVAAASQTPVLAFGLSMLCVLIAVGGIWLVSGVARR